MSNAEAKRALEENPLNHPIPTEYECGRHLRTDPHVYVFDEFIKDDEIESILKTADGKLGRAKVTMEAGASLSEGRTGSNCWIPHAATPAIKRLADRISGVVGMKLEHAEDFQVIYYGDSQQYRAHYDTWETTKEGGRKALEVGGQRLVTCLLYLNTVAEGGGTGFPKLNLEVRAVKGRMVVFHNCYEGTRVRHQESLHGGLPVVEGEKYAVNLWFRERKFQHERRR